MTPALGSPPVRVRTSVAPRVDLPSADRANGTAQDLLGLLGVPGNDSARERAIAVQFRLLPVRATLFQETGCSAFPRWTAPCTTR